MLDKRKAYEEKLAAQLEEWNAHIALFKANADIATTAEIDYIKITQALQLKHDEARKKLQELVVAGNGTWEGLKTGVEKTWTEVQAAFHNAAATLK